MMKKLLVFILAIFPVTATTAFGHPPQKVDVSWKGTTAEISVEHPVANPANHYIFKIRGMLNDKVLLNRAFKSQQGNFQNLTWEIEGAKPGDEVVITAYCNRFGRKSVRLKLP